MTEQEFAAQVETMIANLEAIKGAPDVSAHTGYCAVADAFDRHDYPLAVCECAALFSGHDVTFAKMFNRKFRHDACAMMFERAIRQVAA